MSHTSFYITPSEYKKEPNSDTVHP